MEEQAPKLASLKGSITTRAGQRMLLMKKGFSEAVYPPVLPFLVAACANSADLAFSLGVKRWMIAKVNFPISSKTGSNNSLPCFLYMETGQISFCLVN